MVGDSSMVAGNIERIHAGTVCLKLCHVWICGAEQGWELNGAGVHV